MEHEFLCANFSNVAFNDDEKKKKTQDYDEKKNEKSAYRAGFPNAFSYHLLTFNASHRF